MPTRKYRLAPPVDTGKVEVLYRTTLPTASSRLYRVTLQNDVELSSKRDLLKSGKTSENAPATSSPRWWLVLPSVLLMILASASDPLLMNDLIVRRYERYYGLPASAGAQRTACRQSSTTPAPNGPIMYWQIRPPDQYPLQQHPDYNLVQRDAASFNIKNSIATIIPAVIIFLLLGSNSDIIGRRPLLVLPFVGKVVRYTLLLIIVSRNLSDAWLIAAHALEAVFGAGGLVVLSAFSYITDCTGATRTRAFLLTEVFIVIARIIPVLLVSLWLRHYLYTGPLSVDLTLSVLGLLYGIFVLPESVESVKNMSLIRQLVLIRLKPITRIITVFVVKRSDGKRQRIILVTIVTILLFFVLFGYTSIFSLYLYGHPFCLDAFSVGLLSLAQALTVFVASFLVILCKGALNETYVLPLLGSCALTVGLIIFSVAKKLWLLYIAACIGSLFFLTLPVLRTKLTRQVEVNEYAIVFIAAGILETVGHEAVGTLANTIYKATLRFFPGLVFLVFAIVCVIPIAIMIYLAFSEARNSRNNNAREIADSDKAARPTSKTPAL